MKVQVNNISYYGKEPTNYEQLIKYKEEKCKIETGMEKVEREVD